MVRWTEPILPVQGVLIRGYHLIRGLISLHHTRTLYGEALDIPKILLHHSAQGGRLAQVLEPTLSLAFIFVHITWLLRMQRASLVAANTSGEGSMSVERPLVSQLVTSCIFVYGHFLFYHVVGVARPFGGRLALLFAVLGLGEVLGQK